MKKESRTLLLINIGFFFLFLFDRALKWWAINILSKESPIIIFGDFRFELYLNKGIIFSIALPRILIYCSTLLVLCFAIYFLYFGYKNKRLESIIAMTLIIVGALSNLLDRINYGAIVDFVNLQVLPVFNLADCMILTGVIILIFTFNKDKKL